MTRRLKATSRFVLNLILLSITSNMTVFCDSGLATTRGPRATESSTPRAEASPIDTALVLVEVFAIEHVSQSHTVASTAQHSTAAQAETSGEQ